MKTINFLRSLVRIDLDNDDLAYLTKWALQVDYADDDESAKYFNKVKAALNSDFFNHPNKIKRVLESHL